VNGRIAGRPGPAGISKTTGSHSYAQSLSSRATMKVLQGAIMSTVIGRFRRVYAGWRALPGKNLIVFDDAVAVIRASGLDGMPFGAGSGLAMTAGAVAAAGAMRRRGSTKNNGLSPGSEANVADLVARHSDNWSISSSEIVAVRLDWPRLGQLNLGRAKVIFSHGDTERIVEFETGPNPRQQVERALAQVFGERLHTAQRNA
jgi:hypothetical protein